MQVFQTQLGAFETNCFYFEHAGKGYLVDPGDVAVRAFLPELGAVDVVLLTHGHVDHVLGIAAVKERYPGCRVVLAKADLGWYDKAQLQAKMFGLKFIPQPAPDDLIDPPCELDGIRVLATPGHTPGGVSFFLPDEGVCFSGDTLFAQGVGRTDFPGGSWNQLSASIRDQLYTLPPSTVVYPGHGPETTIADERRGNPFVSGKRP